MSYHQFIASKHFKSVDVGFEYKTDNSILFDYQSACVEWATMTILGAWLDVNI